MGGEPYTVAIASARRSAPGRSSPCLGGEQVEACLSLFSLKASSLVTCTHSLSLRMTPRHRPRLSLWQLRYTEEGRPDALRGRDRGAESRMRTYVWGARWHLRRRVT